jgi:hypothetical protein
VRIKLCTLHRYSASAAWVAPEKGAIPLAADAELMPNAPQLFGELKRHETFDQTRKPGGWQAAEVAELAVSETLTEGSCLVIVNTKRDALAIYTECEVRLDELHTKAYTMARANCSMASCSIASTTLMRREKANLAEICGDRDWSMAY